MKHKINKFKERYLIILVNIIFLLSSIINSYKSNTEHFTESYLTSTFIIYISIILLGFIFIKNTHCLLFFSVFLFLDIPYVIKSNLQNLIINSKISPNLLVNHIITLLILGIILLFVYLVFKKKPIFLTSFLLFFYSISLLENINKKNLNSKNKVEIKEKIEKISKSYYFLLFDEYPNEKIVNKYIKLEKKDYLSFILINDKFQEIVNIHSNFSNTEKSTLSFLIGKAENKYSINETINALEENIFSKKINFYCISIFDKINRRNSQVTVHFFQGNNSLLNRYIIPFLQHFFINRGVGLFTDYEDYHKQIITELNLISKSKVKKVTYIHFFTPHNYPLVENISIENRLRNANQWIKKSISIIKKNDPDAGIVIFSDHGLRLNYIPKDEWTKNMLFYKNITIDTSSLNKNGLSALFNSITY